MDRIFDVINSIFRQINGVHEIIIGVVNRKNQKVKSETNSVLVGGVFNDDTIKPIVVDTNGNLLVSINAVGGLSNETSINYTYQSLATVNAVNIKTTAGKLLGCATNITTSYKYLKLYDKNSAPIVGIDVPIMVFPIPPNTQIVISQDLYAIFFSTGISFAITGGGANSDTTAIGLNEVFLNFRY